MIKKKFKTVVLTIIFTFSFASGLPTLASTTSISPTINRISGQNRYDTSAAVAKQGWPNGSPNCILTFGGSFSDSLAATPLAKKYDAPILLTESTSLTPIIKQTLINLKTKNVTIIGGTGVISSSVDTELQSMGISTNRIFGNDQYETSIAVAKQVSLTPSVIFVCTSSDFSDALSVSPIASIKQDPIILVPNNSIPDSVKNYISANKSLSKSYVIGSPEEISDDVANQFPYNERIVGNDTYSTNIAIDKKFDDVFNPNNITVASGEQFPDALSGSALASKLSAPIILVNDDLSADTRSYYWQKSVNNKNNCNVYVFGGTAIVSDNLIQGLGQEPATISRLSVVNIDTIIGTAPVLPSTVAATMSDGTTKIVNVTWPSVDIAQYASEGTFVVIGSIAESTTIKPSATVTVADVNPINTLTTQQVQQDIIGTWKSSDDRYTLKFNTDGTLEDTDSHDGYSFITKEKYSIISPTKIKIVTSDWAEIDNLVFNGNRFIINYTGYSGKYGNYVFNKSL